MGSPLCPYHFGHGAVLVSHDHIKKTNWKDTALHTDFPDHLKQFPNSNPFTFFVCLGPNPIPLDFGSISTSQRPDRKRSLSTVILAPGDIVLFSWRQFHRTGYPLKFPTCGNYRFHVLVSEIEGAVQPEADTVVQLHVPV